MIGGWTLVSLVLWSCSVHEVACDRKCSDRGTYDYQNEKCFCEYQYEGERCEWEKCRGHGAWERKSGECECFQEWTGSRCLHCPLPSFQYGDPICCPPGKEGRDCRTNTKSGGNGGAVDCSGEGCGEEDGGEGEGRPRVDSPGGWLVLIFLVLIVVSGVVIIKKFLYPRWCKRRQSGVGVGGAQGVPLQNTPSGASIGPPYPPREPNFVFQPILSPTSSYQPVSQSQSMAPAFCYPPQPSPAPHSPLPGPSYAHPYYQSGPSKSGVSTSMTAEEEKRALLAQEGPAFDPTLLPSYNTAPKQ